MNDLMKYATGYQDYLLRLYSQRSPVGSISNTNEREAVKDTLEKAIPDKTQYDSLVSKLIAEGIIRPDNHLWLDRKSGWMRQLASKIKSWESLTGKLSPEEIKAIAKNSFHAEIGISTIEKAKPH